MDAWMDRWTDGWMDVSSHMKHIYTEQSNWYIVLKPWIRLLNWPTGAQALMPQKVQAYCLVLIMSFWSCPHSLDGVSAVAHVPGTLHELFNRSSLQEGSRQRRVRRGVGRICTLTAMVDKHKLGWVAHSYTAQDDFNGSREAWGGI